MKAAKRLGTKALAGVLAIGLIVSTPAAVLADGETETAGTQSTASQTPVIQAEKLQAKSVDGKDTLTDVSDTVKEMIQRGEVKLDESTGYLIDTTTGQKTNPVTGERVDQIPAIPATPVEPAAPAEPEQPAEPVQQPEPPVDSVSPSFPTQMPFSSPASRSSWKKPDWNPTSKMLTSLSTTKTKTSRISVDNMHSDLDHTIWEGKQLHGYPIRTYLRGNVVYDNGDFVGTPGLGEYVKRSPRKH